MSLIVAIRRAVRKPWYQCDPWVQEASVVPFGAMLLHSFILDVQRVFCAGEVPVTLQQALSQLHAAALFQGDGPAQFDDRLGPSQYDPLGDALLGHTQTNRTWIYIHACVVAATGATYDHVVYKYIYRCCDVLW